MKSSSELAPDAIFPSGLYLDFTSDDAEEMREQALFWPFEHKQFSKGKFQGKIIAIHTRRMQISIAYRSQGIYIRGGIPNGTTVISFPLSAGSLLNYRGQLLANNQTMAMIPGDELEIQTSFPSTLLAIAVNSELLERQAFALTGNSFDELRSQERLLIDQNSYKGRANHIVALLKSFNCHSCALSEVEEKIIENTVLETILLGVNPYSTSVKVTGRSLQAKKAEAYIRSNLKHPLSINELCLATSATERTLHLGFKERLGVTPGAFIRMMRLNEVRRGLRLNSNRSVTEIAMDWGFYHLGHFAEQYRLMFGELPSKTKNN